jgi:hypothetical protein
MASWSFGPRFFLSCLVALGCADAGVTEPGPVADSGNGMGGQPNRGEAGSTAHGGSTDRAGSSDLGGNNAKGGDGNSGGNGAQAGSSEPREGGSTQVGNDASATTPPLCAPGGAAIFCEGFESAALDAAWNPVSCDPVKYPGGNPNATGSQQRDTTRASTGLASWHAHVDFGPDPPSGGSCQAELRRSVTLPTPDAFLRAFVYVPAGNVPFEFNMLTDTHGFFAVGLDYPLGPLHAGGYDSQGSPVNGSSMIPFPTDRWVCVEWQLHQGSSPSLTAWQENIAVIDQAPVKVAAGAHLDGLFFGIYVGNSQNSKVDLWLDDVALSATRIGCAGH